MRLTAPWAIALSAGLVYAQNSLSDLPACAQSAALAAIQSTSCGITDTQCICEDLPFLVTLRTYVQNHCDCVDAASSLAFANNLCMAAGVSISAISNLPCTTSTMTMTSSSSMSTITMSTTSTLLAGYGTTSSTMASEMPSSTSTTYASSSMTSSTSPTSTMPMTMSPMYTNGTVTMTTPSTSAPMISSSTTSAMAAQYTGGAARVVQRYGVRAAGILGVFGLMAVL